jgi:O-antigen/teichoic acid export membrane protein
MSLTRKIAGHTLVQVIGKLTGNIIGVIVVALLTRYLGQEGFGNYTTILAYLFFFAALADLGLYMITITEINKTGIDKQKFFSAVYSLRFFTGIILMISAALIVWLLPYPLIVKQGVVIISLSIFFSLLDQLQVAYYQAQMKMIRTALADVIGKLILIGGIILGIYLQAPLLILLWAVVVGHGIQFLINLWGVVNKIKLKISVSKQHWQDIIKKTWPIALSQIFVLIYFKMDTVFLSLLRPASVAQVEVGLYGAPYKFLEVAIAFVPLFMGLIAPVISQAWSEGLKDNFNKLFQGAFDVFSIFTWPIVIGGVVLAVPLMQLIAPGFAESQNILRILMIAIGIIFFAHLPTYVINIIKQQRQMLKSYALAAILAIVLYVILIPIYSYYAAAGVTVFIELLILIMAWRRVKRVTAVKINWLIFFKSMLAAAVMAVILIWLINLNIFILLLLGIVVYLLIMLLIKGIKIDMIKEILVNRETN